MGRSPGRIARLTVSRCKVGGPLAEAISDHLAAIAARGLSPYTVAERSYMLARFASWADERGVTDPAAVSPQMLEAYQRHLFYQRKRDGQPLSFASQYSHLVAVKAFFSWATRAGLIGSNPASEIDMPKLDRHLPKTLLSPAEIEQVLAVPDLDSPVGLRDRTMMEVLWATGMRTSTRAASATVLLLVIGFLPQGSGCRRGRPCRWSASGAGCWWRRDGRRRGPL